MKVLKINERENRIKRRSGRYFRKMIAFGTALLLFCASILMGDLGIGEGLIFDPFNVASVEVYAAEIVTSLGGTSMNSVSDGTVRAQAIARMRQMNYHEMKLDASMRAGKRGLKAEMEQFTRLRAGKDYAADELIVMADNRADAEKIAECYDSKLENYGSGIGLIHMEDHFQLYETLNLAASDDTNLPPVYPNYYFELDETPNDPLYNDVLEKRWQHDVIGSTASWAMDGDGSGVTIAVIDSGTTANHVDLDDNLLPGKTFCDREEHTGAIDIHGHGTHVCGIAAAEANNGVGSFGVAPKAKILPIRVVGSDNRTILLSDIAKGIHYATDQGVDVINMSLGSSSSNQVLEDAVWNAINHGIVIVGSAGNDGSTAYNYPASMDPVIAVANVKLSSYGVTDVHDATLTIANSSNYGDWVDFGAPGENVWSTTKDGLYGIKSGTSMSSPVVAGAVACILSAYPQLKDDNTKNCAERVRNILKSTVNGVNSKRISGCINVEAAVKKTLEDVKPFYASHPVPTHEEVCFPGTDTVISGSDRYMKLRCAYPGAKIYYTIDGETPSEENGTLYEDPGILLEFIGEHTIRAVAVFEGICSDVMEFTALYSAKPTALKIEMGKAASINVPVGGSARVDMIAEPAYAPIPNVTGSSDSPYFSFSDGKIYCAEGTPEGTTGRITICSVDDPDVGCSVNVIAKTNMALKLSLPYKDITMYSSKVTNLDGSAFCVRLPILEDVQCTNASATLSVRSNVPQVVEADAGGVLHAKGNGTAIVYVTADFKGKKKTIKRKVVVKTPVYRINSIRTNTGYTNADEIPLADRGVISLLYVFNEKDPENGTLDSPTNPQFSWTSDASYVQVRGKRIVCKKGAHIGSMVTLTAVSKECDDIRFELKVKICDPIRKMGMPSYERAFYSVWNEGLQRSETSVKSALKILKASGASGNASDVSIQSTNPQVLLIEEGMIKAITPGTTRLIFTARDGSGKKYAMKIKVR